MSRRGSPFIQVLAVVLVVCLFLYGFYCYHDQHTRLRRSEDTVDKLKQKTESLSAQLQVLYEHRTRLETSIQLEKEAHKKTKEDLQLRWNEIESKLTQEKSHCESLKGEGEALKTKAASLQDEVDKLTQNHRQMQQECKNDVARLQDDVANLKRHYEECEKLRGTAAVKQPDSLDLIKGLEGARQQVAGQQLVGFNSQKGTGQESEGGDTLKKTGQQLVDGDTLKGVGQQLVSVDSQKEMGQNLEGGDTLKGIGQQLVGENTLKGAGQQVVGTDQHQRAGKMVNSQQEVQQHEAVSQQAAADQQNLPNAVKAAVPDDYDNDIEKFHHQIDKHAPAAADEAVGVMKKDGAGL